MALRGWFRLLSIISLLIDQCSHIHAFALQRPGIWKPGHRIVSIPGRVRRPGNRGDTQKFAPSFPQRIGESWARTSLFMKERHERHMHQDHGEVGSLLDDVKFNRRAMLNTIWFAGGGIAGYLIRDQASDIRASPRPKGQPAKAFNDTSQDSTTKSPAETKQYMSKDQSEQSPGATGDRKDDTPLQKLFELAPYGLIAAVVTAQVNFVQKEWQYAKQSYEGSEFTFGELILYRLDHYLSTEPLFKTLLLGNAAFLIILIGASLLSLTGEGDFGNELWVAWTLVADAGTESDAEGPLDRAIELVISVGGLMVFALLVGFVTESVVEQVEDFKKGSSRVLERDHTVMLGFSDKSLSIIEQVALSRMGRSKRTIVVLAEKPKDDMETTLVSAINDKERGFQLYGTEVIFRTGDPAVESELFKVGADRAKRIIALSRDDLRPQEADALMLRQVLSLRGVLAGDHAQEVSTVVELQDVDNKHLIDLISLKKEVLVTHDFIGRLMVRCARTEGLATVLEALTTFKGPEFYLKEYPELVGLSFEALFTRFKDAVPVGMKKANGQILLNPPREYILQEGYKLIVLAEDNSPLEISETSYAMPREVQAGLERHRLRGRRVRKSGFRDWTMTLARTSNSASETLALQAEQQSEAKFVNTALRRRAARQPEKILFVGWRRDMADMISDLDGAVPEGSELWLLNAVPVVERGYLLTDKGNKDNMNLRNLVIKNAVGRPTLRQDLLRIDRLDEFGSWTGESVQLTDFTSTLILSDEKGAEDFRQSDVRSADGRSLASFLLIREIRKELKKAQAWMALEPAGGEQRSEGTLISEIVDSQNSISLLRELGCRSYIMSNEIVSSVLAQISENPDMFGLISELFKDAGAGLTVVPIEEIVPKPEATPMCFWDVALQALKQGEVVIGYKAKESEWMAMADWMQLDGGEENISWINPDDKMTPRTWREGDSLVVISSV